MNIHTMTDEELDRLDYENGLRKKVMKFQTMGQVVDNVEEFGKQSLIKGILYWNETSAWIAPPGGMKSALLASAAVHLTAGRDWHGYKVKHSVAVIYFALERADLVRRRLVAQARRMGIDPATLNIIVVSEMIDLLNPASVRKVIDLIGIGEMFLQEVTDPGEDKQYYPGFGLIIFDTFAKLIAAGGGDEDKAKDQGRLFANLQLIKNETAAHIALIGHTGKDETRGSRGSNAIVGDVDVMVTISGDDIKTATVIKANDAPEGPLFSFKSETYSFGTDEDGDPITVNIVSTDEVSGQSVHKAKAGWPRGLKLVHDAVAEAVDSQGAPHRVGGDGPIVRAVPVSSARQVHSQRYVSNGDGDRGAAERKAWQRNFKEARDRDLISGANVSGTDLIWIVREDAA